MGVEVARGASELGRNGDVVQHGQLPFEPLDEDHELLAEGRGRSGLPVRACQHRHAAPLLGESRQTVADLLRGGVVDACEGLLERERDGRVVDVLRREAEVYEFLVCGQSQRVHLLLDDVFDGLDVVVRHRLDLLDALRVGFREVRVERAQGFGLRPVDARELRQRELAQGDEILHFDADAVADQCLFRKIIGEFFRFVPVAPVYGRNGGKGGQHSGYEICSGPKFTTFIEIRIIFPTFVRA